MFRLHTWPTKQVFCLNLRRILDIGHFEWRLNQCFWRSKKVVQVVQMGGGGFGQNPKEQQFFWGKPFLTSKCNLNIVVHYFGKDSIGWWTPLIKWSSFDITINSLTVVPLTATWQSSHQQLDRRVTICVLIVCTTTTTTAVKLVALTLSSWSDK